MFWRGSVDQRTVGARLLGASILTVVMFGNVAFALYQDPVITPMRVTALVVLATGMGVAWGAAIWRRRHGPSRN